YKGDQLPKGPYPVGRCVLPSELYLAQPLVVNLLTTVAKEVGGYHTFDTHNTPLTVVGREKVDVVVTRDKHSEQKHEHQEPDEAAMAASAFNDRAGTQSHDSSAAGAVVVQPPL